MLAKAVDSQQIEKDKENLEEFLRIIVSIANNHHRDRNFIDKINQILFHYKDKIKQTLSNLDIFHIFEKNKIILLFLIKNDIVTFSETICSIIMNKIDSNGLRYCYYFYPEIEKFISNEKFIEIKNELLSKNPNIFDNYEDKRQKGENDWYICSLIRQDLVEEFISYVTSNKYSLSSQISHQFLKRITF